MLYIQESLAPGEKILKFTQYHWMYVAQSALGASIFVLLAFAMLFVGTIYHYYDIVKVPPWRILEAAAQLSFSDYVKAVWHINILIRVGAFLLFLMAIIQVGARILVRVTTEMGVTNRRVVFKRGLISRKVDEMRVDFIDGADLDQGIWGRIFNYGGIKMYGTGVEGIFFPYYTEDPVNFRRAIQAARAVQTTPQGGQAVQNPRSHAAAPVDYSDSSEPHHPLHQQNYPHQPSQHRVTPTSEPVTVEELKNLSAPAEPSQEPIPGSRVRVERHEQ